MHGKNSAHVAEVYRYTTDRSVHVAFERGSDSERNDGDAVSPADAHDLLHFVSALRIDDSVGGLVDDPGDRVAMLLTHGLRSNDAIAGRGGQLCNRLLLGSERRQHHAIILCYVRQTLAEDRLG